MAQQTLKEERHKRIQRIAHSYWEKAGCPEGKDLEFWLDAEKKVDEHDESVKKYGW